MRSGLCRVLSGVFSPWGRTSWQEDGISFFVSDDNWMGGTQYKWWT
jgi:hypothetical protein